MSGSSRRSGPSSSSRPPDKPDFLCRPRFSNTLPDLPFDGKFLPCPFVDLERFIAYKPTLLEHDFKYDVVNEFDVGVPVQLVDATMHYKAPTMTPPMDRTDQYLCSEENINSKNSRRSQQHSTIVPWMRKTEYISSEFTKFGKNADRQETTVGYKMLKKQKKKEEEGQKPAQKPPPKPKCDFIKQAFEKVKEPLKAHPTKPDVFVAEEFDLLPDFDFANFALAEVDFGDSPPEAPFEDSKLGQTALAHGQIRGMEDEEGRQFVRFYVPSIIAMQKEVEDQSEGKDFDPEYKYEYEPHSEYEWMVRNTTGTTSRKGEYLLSFRDGKAFLSQIATIVQLTLKDSQVDKDAKMFIELIPPTDEELKAPDLSKGTRIFQGVQRPAAQPAPPHEPSEAASNDKTEHENKDEDEDDDAKNNGLFSSSEEEDDEPKTAAASKATRKEDESDSTGDSDSD